MRYRKGTKVEVFSIKESPYGAWRCAEIISGNGHTYVVRYNSSRIVNIESVEERVPRKMIRPCPPQIALDRWEAGELVEVLDHTCWKTATVLKELCGRNYVVRLLGAITERRVHKVNLRVRHSWQDGQWVMIGKVSCSVKSSTLTGSDAHKNLKPFLNRTSPQELSVVSKRMLERPSPYNGSDSAESCTRSPKKRRSLEEGNQHHFASTSVQKVDVYRPEHRGGKMHGRDSVNNHKSGCCRMVRVRSKRFSDFLRTGSSDSNGYDCDACSVGSCSPVSYDESDTPNSFLDGLNQDAGPCSSVGERSKETLGCGEEESWKYSLAVGRALRFSRPELYTYRSKLRELFASGAISWEQEALLTDLRFSLDISADEHLMELRNLTSAGVGYTSLQCGINCYIFFFSRGFL